MKALRLSSKELALLEICLDMSWSSLQLKTGVGVDTNLSVLDTLDSDEDSDKDRDEASTAAENLDENSDENPDEDQDEAPTAAKKSRCRRSNFVQYIAETNSFYIAPKSNDLVKLYCNLHGNGNVGIPVTRLAAEGASHE